MKLKITVHGIAYEVEVEVLDPGEGFAGASPLPRVQPTFRSAPPGASVPPAPGPAPGSARASAGAPPGASTGAVTSPIAGTVLEVRCKAGDRVTEGQILMVIEAMKMETSIAAPAPGSIKTVAVAAGDAVREGQTLVEFA